MLANDCGILSPSSLGGGQYQVSLLFSNSSFAKYLRPGDWIIASENGETYEVVSWATQPSDFASGGVVVLEFVTNDVIPIADSGFNSTIYTPGQLDVRPEIRTSGLIGNISLYSGTDYEYELEASWAESSQANQAVVGDRIIDAEGKEYSITFIDPSLRFNEPFRVTEVHKEGVFPISGTSTLYRPSENFGFFQGTELTDKSRTVIQNRDSAVMDYELGKGLHSIAGEFLNNSGTTLSILTPVCQVGGEISDIDITDESQVENILGVLKDEVDDGFFGTVIFKGLIKEISTSFAVDDVLFLSPSGGLTNVAPEVGQAPFSEGDHVVKIGKITKNEDNPANKDLLVDIEVRGQL